MYCYARHTFKVPFKSNGLKARAAQQSHQLIDHRLIGVKELRCTYNCTKEVSSTR